MTRDAARQARLHGRGGRARTSPPASRSCASPSRRSAGAPAPPERRRRRSATRSSSSRASARARRASRTARVSYLGPFDANWEYVLDRAIMTTAMNPGLGGGPLLDTRGAVVGVVSLNLNEIGRFSLVDPRRLLPRRARRVPRPAAARPPATRAWLGIFCYAVKDHVVIAGLLPGGPGEQAGLKAGDVVLARRRAGRRRPPLALPTPLDAPRPASRSRSRCSAARELRDWSRSPRATSRSSSPRPARMIAPPPDAQHAADDAARRLPRRLPAEDRRHASLRHPGRPRAAALLRGSGGRAGCTIVTCSHEPGVGFAADGYARATGSHRRRLRHLRRRRPQHGEPGRRLVLGARAGARPERRSRRGGAQARHAHPPPGEGDRVAAPHLPGAHLRGARARRPARAARGDVARRRAHDLARAAARLPRDPSRHGRSRASRCRATIVDVGRQPPLRALGRAQGGRGGARDGRALQRRAPAASRSSASRPSATSCSARCVRWPSGWARPCTTTVLSKGAFPMDHPLYMGVHIGPISPAADRRSASTGPTWC